MSILVNAVEHGEISKGLLGASKQARRAAGAAKAHGMIAGKYEAANRGRPGAVTAAAGTRFKSSTQLRRNTINEIRGENTGRARFHRDKSAENFVRANAENGRTARRARAVGAGAAVGGGAVAARRHVSKADKSTKALMGGVVGGSAVSVGAGAKGAVKASQVRAASRSLGSSRAATKQAMKHFTKGPRRASKAGLSVTLGSAAGLAAQGHRRQQSVAKSAFGVELGKMLGDDNAKRGGVRSDYVPAPKTTGTPPGVLKARKALAPLKSAALAAAKK